MIGLQDGFACLSQRKVFSDVKKFSSKHPLAEHINETREGRMLAHHRILPSILSDFTDRSLVLIYTPDAGC